ncbi:MAG: MFS transporter [Oscillibacter sp.]
MKLNAKRTILVGFAFLSICAFWQMYNSVIPLILTNTFHLNEAWSGVIMAADNVLALFLLPLFGALSDRCRSPWGRRKPFLVWGTAGAVLLMLLLPALDNSYAAAPAMWKAGAFIGVLACLLITMSTYRSPAVALMPDVTPKPLRSKGNAVINLMGAVGGILYLLLAAAPYSGPLTGGHVDYFRLFAVVAGVMVAAVAVVAFTIREREIEKEMQALPQTEAEQERAVGAPLPPAVRRSLGFLLVSIALWFIGYNAIETWFTTYANRVWGMSLGSASLCLTVATAGAIVSYLPIGALASRVGRKRTIVGGAALLTGCFFTGFLYTLIFSSFSPVLYLLFALVGLAWAAINVNSLPMVVEMCAGGDIGKFTGYYYAFSMAAQTVTPIAAGWLLKHVGYVTLFPYAAAFVAASLVTMLGVKHGDTKILKKTGPDAFDEGA